MLADGTKTKVNDEGITYYNNLINALLEKGGLILFHPISTFTTAVCTYHLFM